MAGVQSRMGLHVGQNHTVRLKETGLLSAAVSDASTYYPAGGRYITNPFYRGLLLVCNRTADVGTATLLIGLEMYNPATNAFTDMRDGGGNVLTLVSYADGATGQRVLRLYPGIIGADADGVLLVNTVDKWVDQNLPPAWRVKATHGGTSVNNNFSLVGMCLM